jgi:hypothetical protein
MRRGWHAGVPVKPETIPGLLAVDFHRIREFFA